MGVQDHYKGYKHQRMVARQAAAVRNRTAAASNGPARRMPFTTPHHPSLADVGYASPGRSPYPHAADRWQRG